jgi:HPt (histidine-containing phosphotransfer) domain-containing protein
MYLISKSLKNYEIGVKLMDLKYKRQLLACGVELNTTLERFMNNEDLYEKFLVKFLEDNNFDELKKNIKLKNYEDAFANAHTLKGVAANLGLDSLYEILVDMVEELRDKIYDDNSGKLKQLEDNYNEICDIIRENDALQLTS